MKKNIFIIILSFLVVGLAGFIAYDNFFAEKYSKEDLSKMGLIQTENGLVQTDCWTNDSTSSTSKEKSADERYKKYLKKLSKSMKEKYSERNTAGINQYNRIYNSLNKQEYSLEIDNSLNLLFSSFNHLETFNKYKLADDVVAYFLVNYGNGGYQSLYYIKSNGEVHNATIEQIDDGTIKDVKVDVKNVVEVRSVVSVDENGIGGSKAIFVDIDGNIIEK